MRRFLLLSCALLCLAGCLETPKMPKVDLQPQDLTPTRLENWCIMHENEGAGVQTMSGSSCDMSFQARVCGEYRETAEQTYADLDACLAACEGTKTSHWGAHQFDGCADTISYGNKLCRRYCQQHYGK